MILTKGGTILSVNHDWWGTIISYIGYILNVRNDFSISFIKKLDFKF